MLNYSVKYQLSPRIRNPGLATAGCIVNPRAEFAPHQCVMMMTILIVK